ncbi:MAG: hypothetical protein ACJARS_001614, partial [bacterium]
MTGPNHENLPAWVIGDQPDEIDAQLQQATDADPALDALATSLRTTQLRAMEVIGRTDIPQAVKPVARPMPTSPVVGAPIPVS